MKQRQISFEAIGTRWELSVQDNVAEDAWHGLLKLIHQRITTFDKTYSRFRSDSLVTRMANEAGTYDLPSDGHILVRFYEQLYRATNGLLTPLIGQTMVDAGYDASYSFETQTLHQTPSWDDVIKYTNKHITLQTPAMLDFGAAGKGYLVDLLADILQQEGLQNFSINASGDVLQRSNTGANLQIGLENPLDTSEAIGIATISNQSLCASSGNKRAWGDFTHIINPVALKSPTDILATWVIANDTMTADGIATALFFVEPRALQAFSFSYAREFKDTSFEHSPNFPLTLFAAE